MGYLQSARQRLASAAHAVRKHAATAGQVALGVAAVAGAAYHAHQGHMERNARLEQAEWQADQGRRRFEELLKHRNPAPRGPSWNPHANHGRTPSYIVPVKYN